MRLVESLGATTDVAIRSGLRSVASASRVDLLEQPRLQSMAADGLTLHGYEIATFLTRLNQPKLLDADHAVLAPDAEAAQPLYARYWLHNRGPAPLGGLPAVAHLHPQQLSAEPNSQVLLRLTAASDCSDAALHGSVRLVCPDGWTATPDETAVRIAAGRAPGDRHRTDCAARPRPRAVPGARRTGRHRQRRELDACRVAAGGRGRLRRRRSAIRPTPTVLRLVREPEPVDVTAGSSARLAVTVGTDARADLAVEAHLISPWGTWEWIGPAAMGATLPAGGTVELGFDVAPPAWVEPGEWWALVRIGCAGRLAYSPAVKVTVR